MPRRRRKPTGVDEAAGYLPGHGSERRRIAGQHYLRSELRWYLIVFEPSTFALGKCACLTPFDYGLGDWGLIPSRVIAKWYLMLLCLTLSIIRYGSMVEWSSPGNGVVPSPTPLCKNNWKRGPLVTFDNYVCLYIKSIYINVLT